MYRHFQHLPQQDYHVVHSHYTMAVYRRTSYLPTKATDQTTSILTKVTHHQLKIADQIHILKNFLSHCPIQFHVDSDQIRPESSSCRFTQFNYLDWPNFSQHFLSLHQIRQNSYQLYFTNYCYYQNYQYDQDRQQPITTATTRQSNYKIAHAAFLAPNVQKHSILNYQLNPNLNLKYHSADFLNLLYLPKLQTAQEHHLPISYPTKNSTTQNQIQLPDLIYLDPQKANSLAKILPVSILSLDLQQH